MTDTSRRLQRLVSIFRGIVASALLIAGAIYIDPPVLGERYPNLFLLTAFAYAAAAWISLVYQTRVTESLRFIAPVQLFIDIACITAQNGLSPTTISNTHNSSVRPE